MAKLDPNVVTHLEWIGFVQPKGLVVSAPALVRASAILDGRDAERQNRLASCLGTIGGDGDEVPIIPEFRTFAETVLGWSFSPNGYAGTPENPIPAELEVPLTDYDETLAPDYAVLERDAGEGESHWQLLVKVLPPDDDFDRPTHGPGGLDASPHGRMERLLRATGVHAGILVNGRTIRLISAPRGENSGWIDFQVADMTQTAGRPILAALHLLLNEQRLLALPRAQRFAALLEDSRRFQNEVSERLAEQVLHALYELLRGFQAAHDASGGELLREPLADRPDDVYRAMLSVLLRLVFLLYAEERDMLPEDETYNRYYSIAGLYERLREDAAVFPDTMDQRFGAWAQLLVLFRLVHDGADAGAMHLPPRHGVLFDPDRFRFLEGRSGGGVRQIHERIEAPLVPDGTIHRALEKLLVLDGERISYRALDVEQIGSVYETMMGFRLETATGPTVAVKAQKKHGAPTGIDLDALLAQSAAKRAKWLQDRTDRKLADRAKKDVAEAVGLEDLHAALVGVIDTAATPDVVPAGTMILQPSEERRRSGSHYTPRSLTEPIVRTTLEPILERLRPESGEPPTPEAILDLKVCDPAMGSGAFLVEACRQLGDALIEAWHVHDAVPPIPGDEDEVVFARRMVAQRCLYGLDRNPVAVDLAKMSLWLVTLAREHALTFVDHALRHGDSLVGLSRAQIEAFNWSTSVAYESPFRDKLREQLDIAGDLRRQIREADETVSDDELRDLWDKTQFELSRSRLFGDLATAAFFDGASRQQREAKRSAFASAAAAGTAEIYRPWLEELRHEVPPLAPFHWEIEFSEVFARDASGFDAVVGNPPFLGGTAISEQLGMDYFRWVTTAYPGCQHHCDLVAYFFRQCYSMLNDGGCLGLIATNTLAQGDTREGGLAVVLGDGGHIYATKRRFQWPGMAAVIVSVVHIRKNMKVPEPLLDGKPVSRISAYLVEGTADATPKRLASNPYFSLGSKIYGQGFLFADEDDACTPIDIRDRILTIHPAWASRIPPYLVGEEINSDPLHRPTRFVINLSDIAHESDLEAFPELRQIVEEKVRPGRLALGNNPNNVPLKKRWWAYQAHRPELYARIAKRTRVLCLSRVGQALAFIFAPTHYVFSEAVVAIDLDQSSGFAVVQSRVHEVWARFLSSSLKDDLRYTPSDVFETFPFPSLWAESSTLEDIGRRYYEYRAELMAGHSEGLTKTYNRFHDPDETDARIDKLRNLHEVMDRAVLNAYGWSDVPTGCEFLLDYEADDDEPTRRRKPWHYRWPDQVRDDVLARLLELNATRASEEEGMGVAGAAEKLFS